MNSGTKFFWNQKVLGQVNILEQNEKILLWPSESGIGVSII